MKIIIYIALILCLIVVNLNAQDLEVVGKVKITEMDTVTDMSANVVRQADGTLALRKYKIGDKTLGGIIFYIDESGKHGLIADTMNISGGIRWYAGTHGNTQAKGDGPFAGKMNTAIIISSQVAIGDDGMDYAARLCSELQKGGYGDWYLPSRGELELLSINLNALGIGNFPAGFYWSSTELSNLAAWLVRLTDNGQLPGNKSVATVNLRAVRAF